MRFGLFNLLQKRDATKPDGAILSGPPIPGGRRGPPTPRMGKAA